MRHRSRNKPRSEIFSALVIAVAKVAVSSYSQGSALKKPDRKQVVFRFRIPFLIRVTGVKTTLRRNAIRRTFAQRGRKPKIPVQSRRFLNSVFMAIVNFTEIESSLDNVNIEAFEPGGANHFTAADVAANPEAFRAKLCKIYHVIRPILALVSHVSLPKVKKTVRAFMALMDQVCP
jgi:hypothetical protein